MGPGNDKLRPGNPRGKVSFPLRMPSEGGKIVKQTLIRKCLIWVMGGGGGAECTHTDIKRHAYGVDLTLIEPKVIQIGGRVDLPTELPAGVGCDQPLITSRLCTKVRHRMFK